MTKLLTSLFCIFFSFSLYSQNIVLKGTVQDSIQPLSFANVIAKPNNKARKMQFAITDDEGYYRLIFSKSDTVTISVSYLGYKPINFLFVADKNTTKNFVLEASNEQLEEVVIEMPVFRKGDTTTYRTDKFRTGEERKLKNVLKKLPGVEVKKNGIVTVQGKKVTTMLVDGKKFFGGNSKLAVENIPADAVGDIDVIDNYNEIPFLKKFTDSDDLAMNINLKKDKKHFVFGDIEAGKGNEDFYKTHANVFYYSPKTNINFIGNLNNIGEKTFTMSDYVSFQGGFNSVFRGNTNWYSGDFSQFMENQDVIESSQKFAALNITKTTSKELNISGFLIVNHSVNESLEITQNNYTNFQELKSQEINTDNLFGIGKINLEYAPRPSTRFYARSELKRSDNTIMNTLLSTVDAQTNTILTNRDNVSTNFNQNIEWHKEQNEHILSSLINYTFRDDNADNYWQTQDNILQDLIPTIPNQEFLRLFQLRNVVKHDLQSTFKHFWELNYANHIYTTVGNNYFKEDFFTDDFQQLDNDSENNFMNSGFGNDLSLQFNDMYFGIHYKFRKGKLTVKQGAELHNLRWRLFQDNKTQRSKWVILPDFLAKLEFSKSRNLVFNYKLRTSFSNASQFANRFYLRSYNSVFRGNENLENNLLHSANLRYSRLSIYRGLNLSINANYMKQLKQARSTVDFSDQNQFLTFRMFDDPFEQIRLNANIGKKINKIRYIVRTNISFSNYLQEINNTIQKNRDNNYSGTLGIETTFKKWPNFEMGYTRSIGEFKTNTYNRFVTSEPYLNMDYDFLKGFVFSFDYTFYNYQNKALLQENTYDIANVTLSYNKENSGWTYKLYGNNLFNAGFKQSNSFSQYLISDRRTFILPRVLMISIAYKL